MAEQTPKVIREEAVQLTDWDKHILTGHSQTISLARQMIEQSQRNVTNYLGFIAVERFGFPENVDVRFDNFNLKEGKVTIAQLEEQDDPKEPATNTEPAASSSDTSAEPANDETESKAAPEETPAA